MVIGLPLLSVDDRVYGITKTGPVIFCRSAHLLLISVNASFCRASLSRIRFSTKKAGIKSNNARTPMSSPLTINLLFCQILFATVSILLIFIFQRSFFGDPFPPKRGACSIYKHFIEVITYWMTIPCNSHINWDQKNNGEDRNKYPHDVCGYVNPTELFEPYLFHLLTFFGY